MVKIVPESSDGGFEALKPSSGRNDAEVAIALLRRTVPVGDIRLYRTRPGHRQEDVMHLED